MAKKTRKRRRKTSAKARAYAPSIGELELPRGGRAEMRRPRASRTQDMRNATPTFQRALGILTSLLEHEGAEGEQLDAAATEERAEALDGIHAQAATLAIPGAELAELAGYLADNTLSIEGVEGVDWGAMGEEERVDWWDSMGASLTELYGAYLSLVWAARDPKAVKKTRAVMRSTRG